MRILWLLLALVAAGGHAATFTVTSTADTAGSSCAANCTLRQALPAAANAAGSDTIAFNIPGTGPHRIVVGSTLPAANGVLIDGFTQPGASANSHPLASNAVLRVIVDFGALPAATIGINVSGGSTLRGLAVIAPASNVALDVGTASVSGCWFNAPRRLRRQRNSSGQHCRHRAQRQRAATAVNSGTPSDTNGSVPRQFALMRFPVGLEVVAPGAGVPTGTITVTGAPGVEVCVIALPATQCELVVQTPGSRSFDIQYAGDSRYLPVSGQINASVLPDAVFANGMEGEE